MQMALFPKRSLPLFHFGIPKKSPLLFSASLYIVSRYNYCKSDSPTQKYRSFSPCIAFLRQLLLEPSRDFGPTEGDFQVSRGDIFAFNGNSTS